jgi:DnaK suppressor protein
VAKSSVKKPAKAAVAIKKSPTKNSAPSPAQGSAQRSGQGPTRPVAKPASKSVPSKSKTAKAPEASNGKRIMLEPAEPRKSGVLLVAKSKTAAVPTKPVKAAKKIDPNAPRFPENLPVPQAPVPTDGKPRKNQAGFNTRELEHYRELLLAKRRELVGDMSSMEHEALRTSTTNLSNLPLHMADMGTDNYEQEFTLGLVEKDRNLLREINTALAKIQNGTFGLCEGTGKPISKPRLEAQPWAKFSIEHARMLERGGMGIRRP